MKTRMKTSNEPKTTTKLQSEESFDSFEQRGQSEQDWFDLENDLLPRDRDLVKTSQS